MDLCSITSRSREELDGLFNQDVCKKRIPPSSESSHSSRMADWLYESGQCTTGRGQALTHCILKGLVWSTGPDHWVLAFIEISCSPVLNCQELCSQNKLNWLSL